MRRRAKPAKAKAEVKRSPPGKALKDERSEVRPLQKRVEEALEREAEVLQQQAATSEILRVISRSPTDVQPVFDAIIASALRLCDATFGGVFRFRDGQLHIAALAHVSQEETDAFHNQYPRPPHRNFIMGRAFLDGRPVHVEDVVTDAGYDQGMQAGLQRVARYRTVLAVPILRNGAPIGVVGCARREVKPFTAAQIELVKTFADQAVIAIENVRLFNEMKEALEQQTATSEILRVISSSPTDVQPTFDAIAASATQLCGAVNGLVIQFDGHLMHLAAHHNVDAERLEALRRTYPRLPSRGSVSGRAILSRNVVQVPDVLQDPEYTLPTATTTGYRTALAVPMLRDGVPIGNILVARDHVAPFSDKQIALLQTFADQAVIAIENVRLFTELEVKNRGLTEAHAQVSDALEQQTATSEILRVISSSPTDVQPVFDAIAQSAAHLCDAAFGTVNRLDGELVTLGAHYSVAQEDLEVLQRRVYPFRPTRDTASGRALLDCTAVHIHDIRTDPEYVPVLQALERYRTVLAVPMLRDGTPIGTITLWRREVRPFSDSQIGLVKTFADQAVIAIENVRLFKELETRNGELTEALEQQTATAEILRVISESPTDTQPVFDAIADRAMRLCGASVGAVLMFDGELLHVVAMANFTADSAIARAFPMRPSHSGSASARAIFTRHIAHIPDVFADPTYDLPQQAATSGFRAALAVPMLRDGKPVGCITVGRPQAGEYPERQIALLQTFADQAVIAIENVRLFKELETRNRDVTEALEQQTATSEVLKVISRSTFDLQPVLQTLIENATRLCGATRGHIFRFDGEVLRFATSYGASPEFVEWLEQNPVLLGPGSVAGRAASERRTVHVHDVLVEPGYEWLDLQRLQDYRTALAVPMLREDVLLGVITILKTKAEPFAQRNIELVATFADQAVIALENVRLLQELQARTGELARSVEELKALGEVSRAVSSTLDLETVLNTIATRAVQLSNAKGGVIYEYDEATQELSRIRGAHGLDDDLGDMLRATPLRLGEGAAGSAAARRTPVQIIDVLAEGTYDVARVRAIFERRGYRSLLAVPLLFERQIVGVLVVWGREPVGFAQEIVDLLQTLATQSVLAIQNARLFREIADKSSQLEAASRHKSEFLANMSHELRTPLNAIIGFSEVLVDQMFGELNEKQDEYLRDIYTSGQHLLSLINDILDLSKIEAGRMELEVSDFDLPGAIDNALTLVRERASRRGITLGHSVDERLGQIRGDERKVKQVLLNLLSNALKFTPEGGRIDASARAHDDVAEIAVADTGVGIAPEDQEAVFEEFRQVGAADKKVEGTGLGLALSRKFIELHGGRIWVTSAVGAGSTFTFTLPLTR